MSLCQIVGLLRSARYRAKGTTGVWRTLSEGDSLVTGETVEVRAGGTCFGVDVYRLQNRVSGAWANAVTIALDVEAGVSVTRKDKVAITGDATNSTVSIALTYDKGSIPAFRQHRAQAHAENTSGIAFRWRDSLWVGIMSVRTEGKDVGPGGYLEESDARIVSNRRQFAQGGSFPVSGQKIVVDDQRYEITEVEVGDVTLSLELRRCNRA